MKTIVTEQLKRHEGFRTKPYEDSVGKLTVGYGRNLDDVGISEQEAEVMLANDIQKATNDAIRIFPKFFELSDIRQAVIVNMLFNIGASRLMGFKKFRKAVEESRFDDAGKEMLDSLWAKQVKGRAIELVDLMKRG